MLLICVVIRFCLIYLKNPEFCCSAEFERGKRKRLTQVDKVYFAVGSDGGR